MNLEDRNALVLEGMLYVAPLAWQYAIRRGIDYEPVLADAYCALMTLAESFNAELSGWHTYIRANLTHRLVDLHRDRVGRGRSKHFDQRKGIHYPLSLEELGSNTEEWHPGWTAPDEIAAVDTADAVRRLCERQPSRTREMVAMRLDGWSMQRIADEYGISESRVSQIFIRLRQVLERELVA